MENLAEHRRSVTSQSGEDGILAEIFRRIGIRHPYCVEFGAWDGKHLSNVWTLWHDEGWSALLIEVEDERFRVLEQAVDAYEGVTAICRRVAALGEDRLDAILADAGAPTDLDLVSIDIDGDDYHIFAGLEAHRPRCVIVEHNPTIPPHVALVQAPGQYFGCSAKALLELAHRKRYRLCACTETNSIFVREEDFAAMGMEEPPLEAVFPRHQLTYLMSDFDGALYVDRIPLYRQRLRRAKRLRLRAPRRRHSELQGMDEVIDVEVHLPHGGAYQIRLERPDAGDSASG